MVDPADHPAGAGAALAARILRRSSSRRMHDQSDGGGGGPQDRGMGWAWAGETKSPGVSRRSGRVWRRAGLVADGASGFGTGGWRCGGWRLRGWRRERLEVEHPAERVEHAAELRGGLQEFGDSRLLQQIFQLAALFLVSRQLSEQQAEIWPGRSRGRSWKRCWGRCWRRFAGRSGRARGWGARGARAPRACENGGEAGAEMHQPLPEQELARLGFRALLGFREGVGDRPDQRVEEQREAVGRSIGVGGGHEHNRNILGPKCQGNSFAR